MFFISFLLLPGFSLYFSEQLSKVSITPFLRLSGDIRISQTMQVYICCCTSKRVEYSNICSYSSHLRGFKIISIRFVSVPANMILMFLPFSDLSIHEQKYLKSSTHSRYCFILLSSWYISDVRSLSFADK